MATKYDCGHSSYRKFSGGSQLEGLLAASCGAGLLDSVCVLVTLRPGLVRFCQTVVIPLVIPASQFLPLWHLLLAVLARLLLGLLFCRFDGALARLL